jgi:hypothetical protein
MDDHKQDSDCTVGEDGLCIICQVLHGDPCVECGARAFHLANCDGEDAGYFSGQEAY